MVHYISAHNKFDTIFITCWKVCFYSWWMTFTNFVGFSSSIYIFKNSATTTKITWTVWYTKCYTYCAINILYIIVNTLNCNPLSRDTVSITTLYKTHGTLVNRGGWLGLIFSINWSFWITLELALSLNWLVILQMSYKILFIYLM